MTRIIAIANQKGGVGKTTTTVNLSAGLAKIGQRVLMIDLDPQGNATMGSGVDKRTLTHTVYDVLLGDVSMADACVQADACGYAVLGANRELAGAEVELVSVTNREQRLKDVVPMQCEYFALEGLSDLVNTIKQVHANLNPELSLIGLLRVMFDPRITLQQQVSEQIKAHFGDKVFEAVIPRNVRLAEAPSYGLPGVIFDPAAKGSMAFVAFAEEMVLRMERLQ